MADARGAEPLRLKVEDADDIEVVSAALQDAIAKVGDISYEPRARVLTIALNRYRWEGADRGRGQRIRSALQIGSVLAVRARRIRREPKDAVVQLLTMAFSPADPPGGQLVLSFAGGADLKVDVECLDAVLADLSQPWPSPRTPAHDAG